MGVCLDLTTSLSMYYHDNNFYCLSFLILSVVTYVTVEVVIPTQLTGMHEAWKSQSASEWDRAFASLVSCQYIPPPQTAEVQQKFSSLCPIHMYPHKIPSWIL